MLTFSLSITFNKLVYTKAYKNVSQHKNAVTFGDRSIARSEIAGSYDQHMFSFSKILPHSFPKWENHFVFPPAICGSFYHTTASPKLNTVNLLHFNHSVGMEWYLLVALFAFS